MTTGTSTDDIYSQIASSIANPAIQSRDGFGSFGKHRTLFERSHRLIARSCLLAPPLVEANPYWAFDPEYLHFALRHGNYNHAYFVRALTTPTAFEPACIWALFWALVKSEHEFSRKYLPFWSHEERLTGHFISQICERIEEFAMHWSALTHADPKASTLDIWYADTATGSREKETGADLGLIVHGQYLANREFFKVARFQVKKVPPSNTARIELNQTKALLRTPGLGHYLFYHGQDRQEFRRPPTVAPVSAFEQVLTNAEKTVAEGKTARKELGEESIQNVDNSAYDFAVFLTFAFADPSADHGAFARSKSEAVRVLMGGGPPSRLAVISLGARVHPSEWLDKMGEYVRISAGDNQ